jgi:hypothetical protein
MASWQSQINKHINQGGRVENLSVLSYHGNCRQKVLQDIQKGRVDVVLTTYQTIASELKRMMKASGKSAKLTQNKVGSDDDDYEPDNDSDDASDCDKKRPAKKRKTRPWIFDID